MLAVATTTVGADDGTAGTTGAAASPSTADRDGREWFRVLPEGGMCRPAKKKKEEDGEEEEEKEEKKKAL